MSTAALTATALAEELEERLDLFIRIAPSEPTFATPPIVLPAGRDRFALRDPGSLNPQAPRDWNQGSGKTGPATRGETIKPAKIVPGRPYPKNHPSARVFTSAELEEIAKTVDVNDGSPLDLAHQQTEALYSKIVEAAEQAGVKPGLRLSFVVSFVCAKLSAGYFAETTDDARAANLGRCVANAVAACGLKEQLFQEYEQRIAAAEAAAVEAAEGPEHERLAVAEAQIVKLSALVERLSARVFSAPAPA